MRLNEDKKICRYFFKFDWCRNYLTSARRTSCLVWAGVYVAQDGLQFELKSSIDRDSESGLVVRVDWDGQSWHVKVSIISRALELSRDYLAITSQGRQFLPSRDSDSRLRQFRHLKTTRAHKFSTDKVLHPIPVENLPSDSCVTSRASQAATQPTQHGSLPPEGDHKSKILQFTIVKLVFDFGIPRLPNIFFSSTLILDSNLYLNMHGKIFLSFSHSIRLWNNV